MEENIQPSGTSTETNNQKETAPIAAIAYVPFLFAITMLQKKDDAFYVQHAKMGAVVTILFLILAVLNQLLPIGMMGWLLYLIWTALAGLGAFMAFQHKEMKLPGLTEMANMIPLEKWFHGEAQAMLETPTMVETPATTMPVTEVTVTPVAPEVQMTVPEVTPEVTPTPEITPAAQQATVEPVPVTAEPATEMPVAETVPSVETVETPAQPVQTEQQPTIEQPQIPQQ